MGVDIRAVAGVMMKGIQFQSSAYGIFEDANARDGSTLYDYEYENLKRTILQFRGLSILH